MPTDSLTDITDARIDAADVTNGGFSTEIGLDAIKEHISLAHEHIQDELAGTMSDSRLARIELYLTRHLIRFTVDRQVDQESIGPVSRTYSGSFDKTELAATSAGQQAMMLDKTDSLGRQSIDFFSV